MNLTHRSDAPAVTASRGGKRIGILIVAYNAVSTIGKVRKRIPADVGDNVAEGVIFDDASRDHTDELELGLKVLAACETLPVLRQGRTLG